MKIVAMKSRDEAFAARIREGLRVVCFVAAAGADRIADLVDPEDPQSGGVAVEIPGDCTYQVSGRDYDGVGIGGLEPFNLGGQICCASGLNFERRPSAVVVEGDHPGRRLQLAVKIVQGQELDLDVAGVRQAIADAAARSGRRAEEVTLIAVSKYVGVAEIDALPA